MKKAAALSVTVLIFLLCSCSITETEQRICVNRIFTSKIEIQYNETAYTADFTSFENGCSAVFLSPECLKKFGVAVKGEEITYSLENISFSAQCTPEQILPVQAIYHAIKATPQSAAENEEGYTLCGTTKYGSYVMNIDKKTFTPNFIEYEGTGITVKFENIT